MCIYFSSCSTTDRFKRAWPDSFLSRGTGEKVLLKAQWPWKCPLSEGWRGTDVKITQCLQSTGRWHDFSWMPGLPEMTSFSSPFGATHECSPFPQSLSDPQGCVKFPQKPRTKIQGGSYNKSLSPASTSHARWGPGHICTSQGIHDMQSPTFPVTMELAVEPEQLSQLKVINISWHPWPFGALIP